MTDLSKHVLFCSPEIRGADNRNGQQLRPQHSSSTALEIEMKIYKTSRYIKN